MYNYKIQDQKLIDANGSDCIEIYENDLKYIKHNGVDLSRVDGVKKYDRDTIEYRYHECIKDGGKSLDLSHLNLYSLPKLPEGIVNKVKYLFLSENKLEGNLDLSNMKEIVVIDLCNNNLSVMPTLPLSVEELQIKKNKINDISSLSKYPFLKRVDCSYNLIKEIPIIQSLEILVCENNLIHHMPKLNKLKKLVCSNNQLKYIQKMISLQIIEVDNNDNLELINDIPNLKELYCSNTKMSNINGFKKIEILHCYNTLIRKLDYFDTLKELMCDYTKEMMLSRLYTIDHSDVFDKKVMMIVFK